MKGDFSQWRPFDPNENFNGVLHQQGRVLIDPDWNEHTQILQHWQGQAGRDVIGDGIAAVAADDPDGFQVEAANVVTVGTTKRVELQVHGGHAWADGLLVHLGGNAPIKRVATYLEPPIQNPAADPTTIGANVRDAAILEVSREAFNGFQWPERLIEPALGGPDTTERIHTRLAFRLLRLGANENCHTIASELKDDPNEFGKLTVSLQPTVAVPGDCPVVEGGGYTGFEHQLYRIEVGPVIGGALKFKWSQFNGGLVGRGRFQTGPPNRVDITANLTAIVTSGLSSFYLEALEFDADLGQWIVTYGATATLINQQLDLTPLFGTLPAPVSGDPVFFRLWNDIANVNAFTNASNPVELRDGIQLVFDAPASKTYRQGDYWVFPVRAGEIKNPQVLINAQPPQGIRYHRVPLAELNWNAAGSISAPTQIEDCRRHFRPLTKQETCCTYRVGDGVESFGDFNATDYPSATSSGAIQAAINALPITGGQVCVPPGTYVENIVMTNLHDITITGCGPRSRIVSRPPSTSGMADPVIYVHGGRNITIDSLAIEAHETGVGILLEGTDANFSQNLLKEFPLINVVLEHLLVNGVAQNAIRALFLQQLTIWKCYVVMRDTVCLDHAIFALGDDMLIERNVVEVAVEVQRAWEIELEIPTVASARTTGFNPGTQSRGGIQIGGTSDRVRIINNLIRGGAGDGITLGSLIFIDDQKQPVPPSRWPRPRPVDPCDPATPATAIIIIPPFNIDFPMRPASAGTLTEIVIERNRIYDTGMSGIGVVKFFDLGAADEFITVENLFIIGNDIRRCLRRTIAPIPENMIDSVGYGGISLADVERLVIRDNLIADNGPSHLEPVCGIFVLHVEGMEVSRNRILNNGAKNGDSSLGAKIGRRGGINVVYAVTPVTPMRVGELTFPGQNGEPAMKVEANVVSVPLGQALSVISLGPLSIVANEFTSRGVVERGLGATSTAATVFIANLGLSSDLEFLFPGFTAIVKGSLSVGFPPRFAARPGLDDQRLGAYLANGNVLFANNQCVLDVLETGITLSVSSILIFGLDDIAFHGNQCDCSLYDDLVLAQAMLFGFSVRAHDNRLKETLHNAIYSAATFGYMNNTTHNQTTHCILRSAFLPVYLDGTPNTVLVDPSGKGRCEAYARPQTTFGNTTTTAGT